ncbi:hypothetical protein EJ110_NYTH35479 [Nymphaea thermarum]|nr:hypothetical protein EJ110_NYTH35479 [Nymphaea thermarum]
MEFNEGDFVEVWRKDELAFGSWWSAKIISTYGHTCCVRYEQLVNSDGNRIVNAVDVEDLRPLQAPCLGGGGSLMAGYMVEVFDGLCWREVEIINVLSREWFLVRFGSSGEGTKIHKSKIRIPRMCNGRKWSSLGKDGSMKYSDGRRMHIDEKYVMGFKTHSRKGSISEECVGDNFAGDVINPPSKKSKRVRGSVPEPWHDKANGHVLHKRKMRRTERVGACKGPVPNMLPPLPKK